MMNHTFALVTRAKVMEGIKIFESFNHASDYVEDRFNGMNNTEKKAAKFLIWWFRVPHDTEKTLDEIYSDFLKKFDGRPKFAGMSERRAWMYEEDEDGYAPVDDEYIPGLD